MGGKRVRNQNDTGATAEHGGNSTDQIMDLLYDVDISQPFAVTFSNGNSGNVYSPADPTNIPRIKTPWEWRSGIVKLLNPAVTFAYTLIMPAITSNKNLTWPTITSDDTLAVLSNLLNKSTLNTNIVYKDQNNNLGAFFQDIQEIAAPASPSANTGRIFFDSSDEHLKVKKSGGGVADLEVASSISTLNDLSDTTITSPVNTQVLQYNGTQWVNATLAVGAHKNNHRVGGSDVFVKGDDLPAAAMYVQDIADPASDAQRFWLEDGTKNLKYWDDIGTPVKQTIEVVSNKNVNSGYAGLDGSAKIALAQLGGITTSQLSASAGILKTQLAALGLVNADIAAGAGITDGKLAQITDFAKLPSDVEYSWNAIKHGSHTLVGATTAEGIWNGHIVSTGTFTNNSSTSTNWRGKWETAATTNAQAGIRTDILWAKPNFVNPAGGYALDFDVMLGAQIQFRAFIGLTGGMTGAFPTGGQAIGTWGTGVPLVGLWLDEGAVAGATNFRKHTNDGTTGSPGSDMAGPIASNVNTGIRFKIIYDEVTPAWNLKQEDSIDNIVTADIPTGSNSAQSMGLLCYIETKENVAKNFELHFIETAIERRF